MLRFVRWLRTHPGISALVVGCVLIGAATIWWGSRQLWAVHHWREAQAALEKDELDLAGEYLDYCRKFWHTDTDVLFTVARTARRSGILDFAEEQYDECLRMDPKYADSVRQERMLLDVQTGKISYEHDFYLRQKLIANPPEKYLILEALAFGYARNYRLRESIEAFNALLDLRPNHITARLKKAWVLERLEQTEEAENEYRAILELNSSELTAKSRLAQILLATGKLEEAKSLYESLQALLPEDVAVSVGLASVLVRLGETERGQSILEQLAVQHPNDVLTLLELGKLYRESADLTRAIESLRRAIELDPHDYPVRYQLVLCLRQRDEKNELAMHEERLKRIETDVKRMYDLTTELQSKPLNPDIRSEIGAIFLRRGEEREGLIWLNSVLQTQPDHRPTHQVLADYYERTKQPAKAAPHLERLGAANR